MRVVIVHIAARAGAVSVALALGAAGAMPPPATDDMPMADYLGLLARIAPAAEEGARAYLHAYRQRCGQQLATAELRRAMSEGDGAPVLIAMIRASHLRDLHSLAQLGQRVDCDAGRSR